MTDSQEGLVQGRTRWRRFGAVMVPAVVAAGAIVVAMANGAIAASFAVSGAQFKVAASSLDGQGFEQYGGVVFEKNGTPHPVAVSEISSATLVDLCQSVVQNVTLPVIGPVSIVLRIEAGQAPGNPATASNLVIDMTELSGNATFTNIEIGRDASDLGGQAGGFGQSADSVEITDLEQTAWATTAGTFTLNGLHLTLGPSVQECF